MLFWMTLKVPGVKISILSVPSQDTMILKSALTIKRVENEMSP